MSDGSLSQEEIDALLQGTDTLEMDTGGGGGADSGLLSETERSAFQAMLAKVAEAQSLNLSTTGNNATISAPSVEVKSAAEVLEDLPEQVVDVKIDFDEGVVGDHSYVLGTGLATALGGLLMGQSDLELDDAVLQAVGEAINLMTGAGLNVYGSEVGRIIRPAAPEANLGDKSSVRFPAGEAVVKVDYQVEIEGESPQTLTELFSLSLVKELTGLLGGGAQATSAPASAPAGGGGNSDGGGILGAMDFGGAGGGGGGGQQGFGQMLGGGSSANVQPVQFANLQTQAPEGDQGNIGLLMDVDMEMTVELGRTRMSIRDILGIGEGTIIELDKLAGEPVDILVNHKPIAKGEVVVIDENFGVRVTEIISQPERISGLGN